MFVLAGLGLNEDEIPIGIIKESKDADYIFLESYTSLGFQDKIKDLERLLDKEIQAVDREFVEIELEKFLINNKNKKIVLLTIGDPLFATTHLSLIETCKEYNIPFKIIHSASIVNHISKTGLFPYKFGKTISISFHKSKAPYDVIKENKSIGAHTLILLDLDPIEERYLMPNEAAERLLELEAEYKENIISKDEKIVVCCKLGQEGEKIMSTTLEKLKNMTDFEPPCCLIIPGNLNRIEEEFLTKLHK